MGDEKAVLPIDRLARPGLSSGRPPIGPPRSSSRPSSKRQGIADEATSPARSRSWRACARRAALLRVAGARRPGARDRRADGAVRGDRRRARHQGQHPTQHGRSIEGVTLLETARRLAQEPISGHGGASIPGCRSAWRPRCTGHLGARGGGHRVRPADRAARHRDDCIIGNGGEDAIRLGEWDVAGVADGPLRGHGADRAAARALGFPASVIAVLRDSPGKDAEIERFRGAIAEIGETRLCDDGSRPRRLGRDRWTAASRRPRRMVQAGRAERHQCPIRAPASRAGRRSSVATRPRAREAIARLDALGVRGQVLEIERQAIGRGHRRPRRPDQGIDRRLPCRDGGVARRRRPVGRGLDRLVRAGCARHEPPGGRDAGPRGSGDPRQARGANAVVAAFRPAARRRDGRARRDDGVASPAPTRCGRGGRARPDRSVRPAASASSAAASPAASPATAVGRSSSGSAATSAAVVTPVSISTHVAPTARAAARSVAIPSPIMIAVLRVAADGVGGQPRAGAARACRWSTAPRRSWPRAPPRCSRRPAGGRARSGRPGRGWWR